LVDVVQEADFTMMSLVDCGTGGRLTYDFILSSVNNEDLKQYR